jgi:PilZ domain
MPPIPTIQVESVRNVVVCTVGPAARVDKKTEGHRMPTNESTLANHDRRRRVRFPLDTELRYQVFQRTHGGPSRGTGQVQDISSKGLAFRTDEPLEQGVQLKVSMAWPARLDNQCMLRLVFEGTVLRTHGSLVVVTIERPEFRTAGRITDAARTEVAIMANGIAAICPSGGAAL